jgi:hypothetical protein
MNVSARWGRSPHAYSRKAPRRGRAVIIETPLIQEILAEVRREDLHTDILAILQAKFGEVPPELAARVRAVQEVQQLRQLNFHAAVCTDLDAFRAHLPS